METIYRLFYNVGDGSSANILEAVMKNDCAYVIDYYKAGNDINVVDQKKETLLHKACRNDNYEIVDLLIKFGSDINAKNKYLETPLHLAVQFKNEEIAQKLLFENANPNALNKNKVAPLHLAASRGTTETLNILLDHGAKINISDENGAKPIHHAVKSGKKEIIRSLLNSGASLVECDDRKNNVLHYACNKGDDELVSFILRHMTINNSRNIYKETPLHFAAANCSPKSLRLLLDDGYDIDLVDANGQTPIDIAKIKNKSENLDFLLNYKRSNEYINNYSSFDLHRAVCNNNYQYLYEKVNSKNVNKLDYFGKSLLYYAIINGFLRIVKLLYNRGAKIDLIDDQNQTGLLIAVYSEEVDIIKYLLSKKANVNEIFYGRSYLYRAILRNNYDIAEVLIENGADVNYSDSKHRTIYSYAVEYADDNIIDLLIKKNASSI